MTAAVKSFRFNRARRSSCEATSDIGEPPA
jgi:hypothetical protein